MTEDDREKAEEYAERITDILKEKAFLSGSELNQRYAGIVQGVLYGIEEGRKEVREHETTCINRLHHTEKENAVLKEQIELIRKFFNVNEMKEFASYVLYYTANPGSNMCIPNCVYEKVDEMYNTWFKRCGTCNHSKTCGMRSVFEEAKNKDRNAICGEWELVE